MPPKKSKTEQKKSEKKIEDKTFGLKNKKGGKNQKFIQQVQQQASANAKAQNKNAPSAAERKAAKEAAQKEQASINELFKTAIVPQKVPFGVDPKTILCQHFKQGLCKKGRNCKFSHDANIERKSTKIDLYTDKREQLELDTMDKWDDKKLSEVVNQRHGKNPVTTTDIVCKYFIQAVEDRLYGWFWVCPNGADCKYRHALPPGFQLKDKKKRKADDEVVQTLEEWIEQERGSLTSKQLTPVTLESFNKWKSDRMAKQEKAAQDAASAKQNAIKSGKLIGASGKDLFTYNPEMYNNDQDDEDALDEQIEERQESDQEEQVGVSVSSLAIE